MAFRTALVRVGTAFRAHIPAAALKAVPDALRDLVVESAAGVASEKVLRVLRAQLGREEKRMPLVARLSRTGPAFLTDVVLAPLRAVPDAFRDLVVESAAGVASVEVIGVGAFLAVDCRSPPEGVPLGAGLSLGVEGLGLGEDGDWGLLGLTNA